MTASPHPSPSDEIVCRELVELVTPYLEGALPADERALVDQHLASCDGCQAYLQQMRLTIRATTAPLACRVLRRRARSLRGRSCEG